MIGYHGDGNQDFEFIIHKFDVLFFSETCCFTLLSMFSNLLISVPLLICMIQYETCYFLYTTYLIEINNEVIVSFRNSYNDGNRFNVKKCSDLQ